MGNIWEVGKVILKIITWRVFWRKKKKMKPKKKIMKMRRELEF